jgi:copper chaperone
MEQITLPITGMTCDGCVKSVTRVLGGLRGVEKADVSLDQKQAVITYDATKVTVDDFHFVVKAAGFEVG